MPTRALMTILTSMTLFTGPALAETDGANDDLTPTLEDSGYKDVDLVRFERIRIADKRMYRHAISPKVIGTGPYLMSLNIGLRYDLAITDHISVQAGAAAVPGGGAETAFSGRLGVNLQPVGNGLAGFFVGPRVNGLWGHALDSQSDGFTGNVQAIMGYRWVLHPGAVIGFGAGAQYLFGDTELDGKFLPAGEVQLGWAF